MGRKPVLEPQIQISRCLLLYLLSMAEHIVQVYTSGVHHFCRYDRTFEEAGLLSGSSQVIGVINTGPFLRILLSRTLEHRRVKLVRIHSSWCPETVLLFFRDSCGLRQAQRVYSETCRRAFSQSGMELERPAERVLMLPP